MSLAIKERVSLAPYTFFKIGGEARYFVEAKDKNKIIEAAAWAYEKNLPVFILAGGSNVLVSDKGFEGLVVKISGLNSISISGNTVYAEAGSSMSQIVNAALNESLLGVEWAVGIPGTLGGSIRGNAGCFGGEIKDIVASVEVLDTASGATKRYDTEECAFAYRESVFKRRGELVILSADLILRRGEEKEGRELVRKYVSARSGVQDIGAKCAGCAFKNPSWNGITTDKIQMLGTFPEFKQFSEQPHIPAGFLIDQCGLKEKRIGGAMISPKHANYFINISNATAEEMCALIILAKEKVKNKYNIYLEEEVQLVGFDCNTNTF